MAPEQARGEVAGAASDLFSLGCILYRLCTGRPPFEGATILAVLSALASETPRSLREFDPAIIPALDELVMRLLAKDPSGRPATAQAVVESIRAIERELLAERQKVELPDDSTRPVAETLPTLSRSASIRIEGRLGRGLAPGDVPGGSPRSLEPPSSVGVFLNVRPRPAFHVATSPPVVLPSALEAPSVGMAPAKEAGTSSAHREIEPDRTNPGVVRAAPEGNDSPPPDVPPASPAIEKQRDAGRDKLSKPLADGRPAGPDRLRAEDRPVSTMPAPDDWGKPIDPDGDCKFEIDEDNNRIKIAIPGTPHVLSAELGRRNAPRLLRPVAGDFDVSVSVDGVFHPSGRATTKEYAPYHGAGILVWQDERNYLRLEIASDIHRGKVRSYANFELRKGGALALSRGLEIKDGSTHLRLERRGSEVRAAFGPDGVRWTRFDPLLVDFEDGLSVGLVAINSATKPLNAGLEMFSITRRNKSGRGSRGTTSPLNPNPGQRPEARKTQESPQRRDRIGVPISRRKTSMNRKISMIMLTLVAFGTAASLLAQVPSQGPGDAPVRKELDELREKSAKSAPPERIRLYEQGIEEVRKSGVVEKALKVGDRAPDFELPDATRQEGQALGVARPRPGDRHVVPRGLVPLLQHRPPGIPQALAGDPLGGCQPGRHLAGDARQQPEHRREEPPRLRRAERPGEQGRPRLRRGLQAAQGRRRPIQGPTRPGQVQRRRFGRATPRVRPTSSTAKGSSATRSWTRTTGSGPSPPTCSPPSETWTRSLDPPSQVQRVACCGARTRFRAIVRGPASPQTREHIIVRVRSRLLISMLPLALLGTGASAQEAGRRRAEADGPRRALHVAGLRHVPDGREDPRFARREGSEDRADRLPRRLLQRPLEGRLLRPALQPAADDLQRALQGPRIPTTASTTRRCS